jgi:glycyl-tRNA synthetase
MKQLYEIYKAEAEACIKRGLTMPAHDYVLRQSHTFNLLDARGAIGVTERAKFFADMRAQARPSLSLRRTAPSARIPVAERKRQETQGANPQSPNLQSISNPQSFLLELGSEELPPQDVVEGIARSKRN